MNNQYEKLSSSKNYGHTFINLIAYNLSNVVIIVGLDILEITQILQNHQSDHFNEYNYRNFHFII